MMIQRDIFHDFHIMLILHVSDNRLDNRAAVRRMQFHRIKFFRRQLPRFLQNGIRHFDFAHIVKRRRFAKVFYVFRRQFFFVNPFFE